MKGEYSDKLLDTANKIKLLDKRFPDFRLVEKNLIKVLEIHKTYIRKHKKYGIILTINKD